MNPMPAPALPKPRLLLISGGGLIGENILDALSSRRNQVELFATNSTAQGSSLFDFDAVYLVPPTSAEPRDFEVRLLEILDEVQPDLVIPCRDDDVVILAELKSRRPELGDRFLCGSEEVARLSNDKWLSWQFADANSLPFAATLATPTGQELEAFVETYGFPLLVKPRSGSGARDIRLVSTPDQLRGAAEREGYVIQQYLNGPSGLEEYLRLEAEFGTPLFNSFEGLKFSIQILIAPGGGLAGNFCSQNVNRFGTSTRLERYRGVDAAELGEACGEALAKAGWRGPVNIQCGRTPSGRLFIYEFNSRLSGATAARYRMGHDELGLVIRHFTDRSFPQGPEVHSDLVFRRVSDVAITQEGSRTLERDGVWRRSQGE